MIRYDDLFKKNQDKEEELIKLKDEDSDKGTILRKIIPQIL